MKGLTRGDYRTFSSPTTPRARRRRGRRPNNRRNYAAKVVAPHGASAKCWGLARYRQATSPSFRVRAKRFRQRPGNWAIRARVPPLPCLLSHPSALMRITLHRRFRRRRIFLIQNCTNQKNAVPISFLRARPEGIGCATSRKPAQKVVRQL